jgi:hypothetical protein
VRANCEGVGIDQQGGGRAHPQLPQPAAAADLPASRCHNACAQSSPSLKSLLLLDRFISLPTDVDDCLLVRRQADVETDEVYAQMTLQPLNPVSHRTTASSPVGRRLPQRHGVLTYGFGRCCAARAERCVPARGDGGHEQAANQLLLQDADGQRHQHARRVLRAPSCRRARLPTSGVIETVIWGPVPFV